MVKSFITLAPGACTLKLFTAVIVEVSQQGRVFPYAINFQPSTIFAGKAGALLEWSYLRDCALVVGSQPCPHILDQCVTEWHWQNTLPYWDIAAITAIKSFIIHAPDYSGPIEIRG